MGDKATPICPPLCFPLTQLFSPSLPYPALSTKPLLRPPFQTSNISPQLSATYPQRLSMAECAVCSPGVV